MRKHMKKLNSLLSKLYISIFGNKLRTFGAENP